VFEPKAGSMLPVLEDCCFWERRIEVVGTGCASRQSCLICYMISLEPKKFLILCSATWVVEQRLRMQIDGYRCF
jgi:hypothetical protein